MTLSYFIIGDLSREASDAIFSNIESQMTLSYYIVRMSSKTTVKMVGIAVKEAALGVFNRMLRT